MLVLLAVQALGSSATKSATFDEPYHLGAGYAYLRTGDVRLNNDHPPLIDAWVALPLLLLDPYLPLDSAAWQQAEYGSFGDVFMWQANPDLALRMIWLGRLPNVALAILLGAAIFHWTSELSSRTAGLLALILYTLDPGIVANARTSTNDLGVATMLFFATWAWWRWLERPSLIRLILAGLMAGAACASKYSGLIIGPTVLLIALTHRPAGARSPRVWLQRAIGLAGVAIICCLTLWAVYGFTVANGLPAPAFWEGIRFQGDRLINGQPAYALGRVWSNGVWFYYPLALILKTPLPVLILFCMGVLIAAKRRTVRAMWPFLLPMTVFGAVALISALQLGHRYLLPMLPFMFGVAGHTATAIPRNRVFLKKPGFSAPLIVVVVLVMWLALDAVAIYPHHLSFFNGLVGGAINADHYLVDANLDWGQDLPALKAAMQEHSLSFVHLGYFGSAVPDVYGIHYWPAPGFLRFVGGPESMAFNPYTPDPGWYAISRTNLRQGLVLTHPDLYAYFRPRSPEAHVGYSINLYSTSYSPATPVVRAVVQGSRVADVPAEQLGWREGQRLIVKWMPDDNSFVLAMSGPARYLVADPLTYAPDLRDAVLRHAQSCASGMLEFDARYMIQPLLERWSAESPLWTPESRPLAAPVEFDDRVQLLGYRLTRDSVSPGEEVSLVLLWQVSGDLRPPIASFVHLLDEDERPCAQYDGWGTAIRGLEIGDVIVHHVHIPIPIDAEPGIYRLQLGVYSPDTMIRWPCRHPALDGVIIDRIWLPEVEVL